jgi:hypothetical protein
MQLQTQRVHLDTVEYAVWGTMTFPVVQRLSDALNATDRRFLALTDVTLAPKSGGEPTQHEFLAIAAQHIVLAVPAERVEDLTGGAAGAAASRTS